MNWKDYIKEIEWVIKVNEDAAKRFDLTKTEKNALLKAAQKLRHKIGKTEEGK